MKRLFYTMLAVCLLVLLALPAGAAERDTAFSDQAEIRNGYAVQMLVELELIGGYKDGSFRPGAPITRAETAKLIAFFCTDTPEPASWVSFADTNDSWAKDYIAYCAGEGIVGGSGGLFRPKDNVTAQELAKMLLAAVGFDASRYTGAGWAARVNADAEENGVYHSFTGQYDEPVTRDDACLLIYNAMQCPATDGTARYVLDELMNPKTYLEERFGAVRYTAVLTGNECADLTQTDAALKKGVTKLEGHKEFAVSTGLGLVGHRVDIYLRNGRLLQILDDGRITDAQGRVVNFENTVIIMTSNAGSDRKDGSVGFGRTLSEQSREKAMKALGEFLRPEFLNRVDDVICFNKLTEENFRGIAAIMLRELQDSLAERGTTFRWEPSLVDALVQKSYSVTYGARNLRRTIQRELEDPIAEKIIDSFEHPISSLTAFAEDGKIQIRAE